MMVKGPHTQVHAHTRVHVHTHTRTHSGSDLLKQRLASVTVSGPPAMKQTI